MQTEQLDVIKDICWAFSFFSDGGSNCIPYILEQPYLLQRLVSLCEFNNLDV